MSFRPLDSLEDVDRMLADLGVPGLSLACTTGDTTNVRTWGRARDADPVDGHTVFQAASIAKPVIAFAALALSDRGGLDPDADVNDVLTSWRVPDIDGWQPKVTTRMLLAHLAGGGDSTGDHYRPADVPVSVLDGLREVSPFRTYTLPNVMSSYSSSGYLVVAQVLCDATGLPLQQAADQLVLTPLGMSSTSFEQPPPTELARRAAHGHERGDVLPGGWLSSPMAMWTTPSDLLRLATAINGNRAPEMLIGQALEPAMGLGLFLTSHDGVDWWSHGGSVRGYESLLVGSTSGSAPFAAAAMTNSAQGALAALEVLRVVSAEHGPGPIVLRHVSATGREAWARMTAVNTQAAGRYELADGVEIVLETTPKAWGQNELVLALPGQPPIELARVRDGMWRIPGFDAYLTFDPPDVITFMQGGREAVARRPEQREE